jgi:hypothetical protein
MLLVAAVRWLLVLVMLVVVRCVRMRMRDVAVGVLVAVGLVVRVLGAGEETAQAVEEAGHAFTRRIRS